MDILLIFVLPISTIILSIVLQKVLKCPMLVAATFFAIFLIIAYTTTLGTNFLIYVIIYTILAYVTAVLTRLICNILVRYGNCCCNYTNCVCGNNANTTLRTNVVGNCGSSDNCCSNINNSNNSASFTVSSSQPNPVFLLTSKSNNANNTYQNTRNTYNCRRR